MRVVLALFFGVISIICAIKFMEIVLTNMKNGGAKK
jgi:hypothetical protein